MEINKIAQLFMEYLILVCLIGRLQLIPTDRFFLPTFLLLFSSPFQSNWNRFMPKRRLLPLHRFTPYLVVFFCLVKNNVGLSAKISVWNWHRSNIWCSSKYVLEFLTNVDFFRIWMKNGEKREKTNESSGEKKTGTNTQIQRTWNTHREILKHSISDKWFL